MVQLDIRCPKCSRNRMLTLNPEDIKLKPSGLISINIEKNFTCEHSYIAYIDHHFNIRDYFDLDYSVELPEVILEEKKDIIAKEAIISVEFDFDLIKLNITPNILTIIFKAIISKTPCVFVRDKDILFGYLIPFFKTITKNSFEFELELVSEEEYKNTKSKLKKSVIVNSTTVLNSPSKFIDIKKLKVEKRIINTFMAELDTQEGLKKIKRHAKIAFDLAGIVRDYAINHPKEKHFYSKNILDYLANTYKITITPNYLDFIVEIINHYFKVPFKLSMVHYSGVF